MTVIRIAWLLLAGLVFAIATVATLIALVPEYQYTTCEKLGGGSTCNESALSQNGYGSALVMIAPVVLCLVPVIVPRRRVAWWTTAALVVAGAVSLATIGTIGVAVLLTALIAVALAASHNRLSRMRSSGLSSSGTETVTDTDLATLLTQRSRR